MPDRTFNPDIPKLLVGNSRQEDMNIYFWGTAAFTEAQTIGPMLRDHYLMLYCTTGTGSITLDNRKYSLDAGQFAIVFPNQVMSLISRSSYPWNLIWVGLKGIFLSFYLQRMGITPSRPIFQWRNSEFILHAITKILHSEQGEICNDIFSCISPPFTTLGTLNRLSCIYSILAEAYRLNLCYINQNSNEIDYENHVYKAISFIEANYPRKIKISDLANYVGVNRSYLFTLFKETLNQSPQEFLTQLRIKKACDMLRTQNTSVASVAHSVGYEPRALSRLFKQFVGITPTEYRQQALSEDVLK